MRKIFCKFSPLQLLQRVGSRQPVVWVAGRGSSGCDLVLASPLSSLAVSLSPIVSDQHQSSQIDLNISLSDPPAGWPLGNSKTDI